jgi:uncharacterized protein YqfA (UPF0365 family)
MTGATDGPAAKATFGSAVDLAIAFDPDHRLPDRDRINNNAPVRIVIAADKAAIDLTFQRAAAIDLAGRDVLDAVRTSVNPKVIDNALCRVKHKAVEVEQGGPPRRGGPR